MTSAFAAVRIVWPATGANIAKGEAGEEPAACCVSIEEGPMRIMRTLSDPSMVALGGGIPNSDLLPVDRLNRMLASESRRFPIQSVSYTGPRGTQRLRTQIAKRSLSYGCTFSPEEIVVTSGCVEAVTLALHATCRPRDTVAIASPVYYTFLHSSQWMGLKVLEIPSTPREGVPMKTFLFGLLALPLTLIAADTVKAAAKLEEATFAGGCFRCMEHPFDAIPGVVSVTAGYTGGQKKNPTYKEVSAGGTGHAEAVQIVFDRSKINYGKLLDVYWRNIDPTTKDRQFCDTGNQYRSAIFYQTEEKHRAALQSKEALEKAKPFKEPVVTEIVPIGEFTPAEEYHQHYYKKNPIRYQYYRTGCGRDRRLKELWGNAAGEAK